MSFTDDGYQPLPVPDVDETVDVEPAPDTETGLEVEVDAPIPHEAPRRRPRAPRTPAKVNARQVRAILAKHAEIVEASASERDMLAACLGVKADAEDLVAHILSTPRLTLAGTAELDEIVESARRDPLDAVAVAMKHEGQARAIWGILSAVGLLDSPRPSNDGTSSVAIARAASAFTDEHADQLDAVRALARKGN